MSRRMVQYVKCDACFIEDDMTRETLPEGWGGIAWGDRELRDLCPSCIFAVLGFLFAKERIDTIIANQANGCEGHPVEQTAWGLHDARLARERKEAAK